MLQCCKYLGKKSSDLIQFLPYLHNELLKNHGKYIQQSLCLQAHPHTAPNSIENTFLFCYIESGASLQKCGLQMSQNVCICTCLIIAFSYFGRFGPHLEQQCKYQATQLFLNCNLNNFTKYLRFCIHIFCIVHRQRDCLCWYGMYIVVVFIRVS